MKLPLFSLSPTNLNAGSIRDWNDMEDLEIRTSAGELIIANLNISRQRNAPHCDIALMLHDRGPTAEMLPVKATTGRPKKDAVHVVCSLRGPYLTQRAVDRIISGKSGEHARLLLCLLEGEAAPLFK
jgi:hypothetical protein